MPSSLRRGISTLVLCALLSQAVIVAISYFQASNSSFATSTSTPPTYRQEAMLVAGDIPPDASVLLIPDADGIARANFWFASYYLLPRRLYLLRQDKPYGLRDVPPGLLRSKDITWVLHDNGIRLRAVKLTREE